MNERIQELFKRAGGKTSIHNLMSNPMQQREYSELWNENIQKFAELIVKECAGIYDKIDNGNLHMGTDNYLEALQKHFGVEE
jgi:zona occludens toxin (predicted ATPase)